MDRYISKELCSKSQYHHKSENNDHLKTTDYQRQSELVSRAVISVYFLSYFLNYDYTYHMTKLKISHFSNVIVFAELSRQSGLKNRARVILILKMYTNISIKTQTSVSKC